MNDAFFLENDRCRVRINAHGAELSSLVRLDLDLDGLEYLWQADPAVWARHAPVLFPIVGRLAEDTYYHNGQAYRMTQHGFARDRVFTVVEQSTTAVQLRLTDDAQSRAQYPFAFELLIGYRLQDTTVHVTWQVRNPAADTELLFSIGAHPAFRCPLLPEESFEDYFFRFDHPVHLEQHLLEGGLLNGQTATALDNSTELPLSYELFRRDALVLKHYDFTRIALASRCSPRAVQMQFDGFPYLGLWTKGAGAPFVCIEPWHGLASSVGAPSELRDKEGILTLAPGQSFSARYTIATE